MAALDAMRLGLPSSEQSSGALGESSGVATFISKVWKIVEKPEYNSLISWSDVRYEIAVSGGWYSYSGRGGELARIPN